MSVECCHDAGFQTSIDILKNIFNMIFETRKRATFVARGEGVCVCVMAAAHDEHRHINTVEK